MAIGATSNNTAMSRMFTTLGTKATSPFATSNAQTQKQSLATAQQARKTAVTTALHTLSDALSGAKFQAQLSNPTKFEAIEEKRPKWVLQDQPRNVQRQVATPKYETRNITEQRATFRQEAVFEDVPLYEMQDRFESRDITEQRDIFEARDIIERRNITEWRDIIEKRDVTEQRDIFETRPTYEDRDVFETRNTYGTRDVYETRPTYQDRDVYETRNTYGTRDVYETRPVYEDRDIFETRNVYSTRDVYSTRPVYQTQDIREAVINGSTDIRNYSGKYNEGIDYGSNLKITVSGHAAATVTFQGNSIKVEQGTGAAKTYAYGGTGDNMATAITKALDGIDGLDASLVNGKLKLKGAEGSSVTIADIANAFLDFSRNPIAALGLTEGTTAASVTGTRQVQTGTEQYVSGTEQYVSGTQQVKVGTERVQTGTQQVKTGTEQYVTGTEQVKVGTERVQTGTEQVKVGTEQYVTGTEQVKTGTERVQTGTEQVKVGSENVVVGQEDVVTGREEVLTGTEDVVVGSENVKVGSETVVVGSEQVLVGQQQVQIGTERRQVGTRSVQTGVETVITGTEQVQVGETVKTITEQVLGARAYVQKGESTHLMGFRAVTQKPDTDARMTLDTQRSIREGILLLQKAIGNFQMQNGVANPYAKIADTLNLSKLIKADSRNDIASTPATVNMLLNQLSKSSGTNTSKRV